MLCRRVSDVDSDLIIVPTDAKQGSLMFEVLERGVECVDDRIAVGTCFYTGKFAPCHIPWPGQNDLYSVNEEDVIGIVTDFDSEPTKLEVAGVISRFEQEEQS